MFRHKAEKRIVELSLDEVRLMREALLAFRNKADKSDEIILKSCCLQCIIHLKSHYEEGRRCCFGKSNL